ncbi:MAG TPA: hypothetical protein VJO32_13520, partial [Ktedonobacteraceae bacterium]|nr:hypothetical protein [Ktedonobacteraceae bacterium]
RMFAIGITVLLLFLLNFAPSSAATKPHGCASPTPPSVSGSPTLPPATPGIVLINEVLNNPGSTWNCSEPAGAFSLATDSWVEVYNPQNQPFNLYAAHTSFDSGPNTYTFHFPFGAAIAAHGYLVVFPDGPTGLLNPGNNLRLTIGGIEIDQVSIPALSTDTSYARIPDGSTNWQITTNPTIDASNMSSTQATPTRTPVSTQTKGSGYSGSGSGSTGSSYTTPTLVTGKQTDWSKLQLPTTNASVAPGATNPLVTTPAASTTGSAWDMTRRILLTVLAVALAVSLLWCWKVFTTH